MKNLLKSVLMTLVIIAGLQFTATASPVTSVESASASSVIGYFLLLLAFIVIPAFKKSSKISH